MGSLSAAAYDALKDALEQRIPALAGRVAVDPQMNHLLRQPALAIFPATGAWDPQQPIDRWANQDNTIALDVGTLQTPLQLRLSWATRTDRENLEQAILDLFLGQEPTPGTLVLPIHVEPHGDYFACFSLEEALWADDSATIPADLRHQSTLSVNAEVPAVGLRGGVYPIEILRLDVGDGVFVVNSDGSLTPEGSAPNGL